MGLKEDAQAARDLADANERIADASERVAAAAQEIAAVAPALANANGDILPGFRSPGTDRRMGDGGNGANLRSAGASSSGGGGGGMSRRDRPWQVTGPITGAATGGSAHVNDPTTAEVRGLRNDLRSYFGGPGAGSTARRR